MLSALHTLATYDSASVVFDELSFTVFSDMSKNSCKTSWNI